MENQPRKIIYSKLFAQIGALLVLGAIMLLAGHFLYHKTPLTIEESVAFSDPSGKVGWNFTFDCSTKKIKWTIDPQMPDAQYVSGYYLWACVWDRTISVKPPCASLGNTNMLTSYIPAEVTLNAFNNVDDLNYGHIFQIDFFAPQQRATITYPYQGTLQNGLFELYEFWHTPFNNKYAPGYPLYGSNSTAVRYIVQIIDNNFDFQPGVIFPTLYSDMCDLIK